MNLRRPTVICGIAVVCASMVACTTFRLPMAASSDGAQWSTDEREMSVAYAFTEYATSDHDSRLRSIDVVVALPPQHSLYRISEDVLGATQATVHIDNRFYHGDLPTQEIRTICARALEMARRCPESFEAPPSHASARGSAFVTVVGDKKVIKKHFTVSDTNFPSGQFHHYMLTVGQELAKRFAMDRSSGMSPLDTDGDLVRPVRVIIGDLLKARSRYHGCRVETVGWYEDGFERSILVDRGVDGHTNSISLGGVSCFAEAGTAESMISGRRLRVTGVFIAGPSGHCGLWPGEVTRLTRVVADEGP